MLAKSQLLPIIGNFHKKDVICTHIRPLTMGSDTNIPVDFQQIFNLVKQLSLKEKQLFIRMLENHLKNEEKDIPTIPGIHKKIVRQRIKKYTDHPEQLVDWEKAQKTIKVNG